MGASGPGPRCPGKVGARATWGETDMGVEITSRVGTAIAQIVPNVTVTVAAVVVTAVSSPIAHIAPNVTVTVAAVTVAAVVVAAVSSPIAQIAPNVTVTVAAVTVAAVTVAAVTVAAVMINRNLVGVFFYRRFLFFFLLFARASKQRHKEKDI